MGLNEQPVSDRGVARGSIALLLLAAGACSGPVRPVAEPPVGMDAGVAAIAEDHAVPEIAADAGDADDAGPAADAGAAVDPYVLTVREESYETFVDIRPRDRELPAWDFRPRSKSISPRWDREAPLSEQTGPLAGMLGRLIAAYGDGVRSARLKADLDVFNYPAYVERLARHAASDPAWGALLKKAQQAGEHRVRTLHEYIVAATRAGGLHPELDEVFGPFCLRPRLAGVEKCSSASPAGGSALGRALSGLGLRGRRPLPAGCLMAWFDLEPAPDAGYSW